MSGEPVTRTVVQDGVPIALHLRKYRLEVQPGSADAGRRVQVDSRVATVGTSPDNDLVLDDSTVSRFHCRIEADDRGYKVTDLDSKNGTFLGKARVIEGYLDSSVPLRLGESVLSWQPLGEEVEVRFSTESRFGDMVGQGLAMREVFAILERVAPTDATVLIEGESGTGKELVAQALHEQSTPDRKAGPFVVFDCSAVPKDLIASELFGHIKGAFTGATADRAGAFVSAHGGTLFLDELGELSPELQPKLLRAIESRKVKPVGGTKERKVDVRLIAATNRKLAREVEAGNFRQDLYYRLAVILVKIPPLRARPEDVPLLVRHFLRAMSKDPGRLKVSYDTMSKLQRHRWPGNVRELKNFIERAILLSGGDTLSGEFLDSPSPPGGLPADIPSRIAIPGGVPDGLGASAGADAADDGLPVHMDLPFKDAKSRLVEAFETAYWRRLLQTTGGNISEAARRAGIHRKSAEYLVKKLDLK